MPNRSPKQRPAPPARTLQAHAHLLDCDDAVVGGAGRRGAEWVIVLDGRQAARTESAALAIALLKHTVAVRSAAGRFLKLRFSDTLRAEATAEARAAGKTLDELLDWLELERAERDAFAAQQSGTRPN